MLIVDKRYSIKSGSFPNREKFLKRYKTVLKDKVKEAIDKGSIKNFDFKKTKVKVKNKDLDIPNIVYDPTSGDLKLVKPGNSRYSRGQQFSKSSGAGKGKGGAGNGGDAEDDFVFDLTEKEFQDIFFEDLALPELVEKQLSSSKVEYKKAGYCKYGSPSSLNIKKTMANAIGRRRALEKSVTKLRYLEESDLRYNFKAPQEIPDTNAVMFCLLDVSGSMGEKEKDFAKRFFILLNMFLKRHYDNVEVVFIKHTEVAKEVEEDDFFYGVESGGTLISSGYALINELIESKYKPEKYNIYIAQSSDGDNWEIDNTKAVGILQQSLLPKIQQFFYMQVLPRSWGKESEFFETLAIAGKSSNKINLGIARDLKDIYPVFRNFFKRRSNASK